MLFKSIVTKLGIVFTTVLVGTLINNDPVQDKAIPFFQIQNFLVAEQLAPIPVNIKDRTQSAIATLTNGNYQYCSQPDPHDWRDGAGVCFNFAKIGDRVNGYYGYPHSDNFICVKGQVNGNLITGEALTISWADNQWRNIPKSAFKWDSEGRLTLSQGNIIRTLNDAEGRTTWILFRNASLNISGFYQYNTPRMKPPSELCEWK